MMEKIIYSPYAWFEYVFIQTFAVAIVIAPNKLVVIPLALLLTALGLHRAFRTAMLTEEKIEFYSLLTGKKKYTWESVVRIRYQPPLRSKGNFKFIMEDGSSILFFSSGEVLEFVEKMSKQKGVKWNG